MAANPEKWNGCLGADAIPQIGLVDVLLVIGITKGFSAANIGGFTRDILNNGWNLRQDDLTLQSDECIDFLHHLLV